MWYLWIKNRRIMKKLKATIEIEYNALLDDDKFLKHEEFFLSTGDVRIDREGVEIKNVKVSRHGEDIEKSIHNGVIKLDTLVKYFPVDDILDELSVGAILEYASKNNPYDEDL